MRPTSPLMNTSGMNTTDNARVITGTVFYDTVAPNAPSSPYVFSNDGYSDTVLLATDTTSPNWKWPVPTDPGTVSTASGLRSTDTYWVCWAQNQSGDLSQFGVLSNP